MQMQATYDNDMDYGDNVPSPLLKWSAVFGGLVLGLALLMLLSALWLALGYGSEIGTIQDNLGWFVGISAIVSLFVAGILTGYLSGVRGAGPGLLHGLTLWGLLMLASVTAGIPALLNIFGLNTLVNSGATTANTLANTGNDGTLWVTFWTLIGGFVAAGIGGMIGASFTRAEPGAVNVVQQPRTVARRDYVTDGRTTSTTPASDTVVVDDADDRSRM
jgi:hypothetical protein